MESTQAQGQIGDITIIKTIGHGATCKVKQGRLPDGTDVAVKIMKDNMSNEDSTLLKTEVEAMKSISHLNIVNVLRFGDDKYVKTSGKIKQVSIIVLEIAQGGEFFDYVAIQAYPEAAACYYFK